MISKLPREVLAIITSSFYGRDIRNCMKVSKEWHKTFEEFWWTHMVVTVPQLRRLQKHKEGYWEVHGRQAISLCLIYKGDKGENTDKFIEYHIKNIQCAQSHFPNIKRLSFEFHKSLLPVPILFQYVHDWISLTHINLSCIGKLRTLPCNTVDTLFDNLPSMTYLGLERMNIDTNCARRQYTVPPAKLRHLEIKNCSIPKRMSENHGKIFPALRSITFDMTEDLGYPAQFFSMDPYSRNDMARSYLCALETATVRIKYTSGQHIKRTTRSLCDLTSFPLKHLSLTASVHFETGTAILRLIKYIPALENTLESLHLDLSNPPGITSFQLHIIHAPRLKVLRIRYPQGTLDLNHTLPRCPELKTAKLELRLLTFEDKTSEPHGLENLELVGLSISSKALENISSCCTKLQKVTLCPTVKFYRSNVFSILRFSCST
ncbi:hypothetical protein CLU79DRAFT_570007 [Phycomyces nitens]|nr:hypothetical protein CLU79DRAFT_570007 [Phycomyces nitens]